MRYRQPVSINTELLVRARLVSERGRRLHVDGELTDGSDVLAEARAAFLHVPLEHFLATPEGRWLALMTAEGRAIPQTDSDRAQALKSMIAYTGRYRVENGQVITKVEAAWNEAWVGGEQVRNIRFEGDRLYIESPPMPHPNINDKTVRVIVVWQREKN